jgi:hypothetical protein
LPGPEDSLDTVGLIVDARPVDRGRREERPRLAASVRTRAGARRSGAHECAGAEVARIYASDLFVIRGIFVLERVVLWQVFVDNWVRSAQQPLHAAQDE